MIPQVIQFGTKKLLDSTPRYDTTYELDHTKKRRENVNLFTITINKLIKQNIYFPNYTPDHVSDSNTCSMPLILADRASESDSDFYLHTSPHKTLWKFSNLSLLNALHGKQE
jgi:hypothetical protein